MWNMSNSNGGGLDRIREIFAFFFYFLRREEGGERREERGGGMKGKRVSRVSRVEQICVTCDEKGKE